jgi:hypothetical protein
VAKETMAGKKKAQRVGKAKGLHDDVGSYDNKKSLNLRKKQLGKKGVAASKKRTVSISDTSYSKKTGIVTGPKGNALTGKVDMGGGNMAVYRNGKRVTAKRPKSVNPNPVTDDTTSIADDAKTGKKAARIAKTTVKARNADTQRRKSGTAKTTTTLAKPKAPKSKYAGSEGPKGSNRQRVIAGARIDDVKVSKRSGSGSNASSWGKSRGSSLSLPSFLKPGKNAPKMPKYTSSSNYKWKG